MVEPGDSLPVCRNLAADMLSCVPGMVASDKRLIDQGYGTTLSKGLRMEKEVSLAHASRLEADFIASQKQDVQERGRQQRKG